MGGNAILLLLSICGQLVSSAVDPGQPLVLTPYLEKNQEQTAQILALTDPFPGETRQSHVRSFSGYITTDKRYNTNMFFWYIPAQDADSRTAPVLLWLDGGPGASSMLSMFAINGPYIVDENIKLSRRKADWTKKVSIIYVDNPIGAGFSFTDNDAGYARNETDVGRTMYSFLTQFFQLFPNLRSNNFYIGGSSYGGKFSPSVAYYIHNENPTAAVKINLKGIIVGAPAIDPENVLRGYPDYLYYTGMMNRGETESYRAQINTVFQLQRSGNNGAANMAYQRSVGMFANATGYQSMFNLLRTTETRDRYFPQYVNRTEIKKALHAGNRPFLFPSGVVLQYLVDDLFWSAKPWLETLLNSELYKILIYNGNLDIIECTPGIRATIDSMTNWKHLSDFQRAENKIWKVQPDDENVAGYVQSAGNLYYVIVIGAGHFGPADQPERHLDIAKRYFSNISF